MLRLEAASPEIPLGVGELLLELGEGESGFQGTAIRTGAVTVEECVRLFCDMTDPAKLAPGLVPQTVFWVLDDGGMAIGMVKVRHCLNEKLLRRGGHVGYYIRPGHRGKGHGKETLRLALREVAKLGETRALVTVDETNTASIRVIEHNGGRLENTLPIQETGIPSRRYWVELGESGGEGGACP